MILVIFLIINYKKLILIYIYNKKYDKYDIHYDKLTIKLTTMNCTCCGRMFVVKEGEVWFCFYCSPDNKTKWRCLKSHTLLIMAELENMAELFFNRFDNTAVISSITEQKVSTLPSITEEKVTTEQKVNKRSQKTRKTYAEKAKNTIAQENSIEKSIDLFKSQADFIYSHIFLGEESASLSKLEVLQHFNITHILCIGETKNYHQIHQSIQYYLIKLPDIEKADLLSHVTKGIQFINSAQPNNVLVHCRAGVSRSASMVIAWLIMEKKMTYEQAFELVENKRPVIAPNDGFIAQLKRLAVNPEILSS
jgi:protein-tyrosine phosphatase